MNEAVAPANPFVIPKGDTITLTCYRCTRFICFPANQAGESQTNAKLAQAQGWRVRNGKAVCPKCP